MNVAATHETPPHAPEAGWARRVLGPFHVTGVFWFRIHRWGVSVLPSWGINVIVALFTTFFWLVLRRIRAAVAANLEVALGPCGWLERQRRIYRTFWSFAWCLSERYELLTTDRRFALTAEGFAGWQELAGRGRGIILLTAHLGNWEVGSMLPASHERTRIHVVREAETDPRAQAFISELLRARSDERYLTHFAADPQLGMVLLDALREGEVVALQGDRPRTGGRKVEGRLFGRPFPLPIGPAVLARAAGAYLVPVFVFRTGRRRYLCQIEEPITVDPTSDRQEDIERAVARFNETLEAAIRRHPYQWFCFRDLWSQGQPAAE
jgi:KDO2-lipid IV(A) lauroyltransferase